jgi:hypothetical protein
LKNKLNIERQRLDFNEKDNKKQIQDSIDVLIEFRDVFIIVVGKKKKTNLK